MNKQLVEGPIEEASYYYPAQKINDFLRKLPETDAVQPLYAHVSEKIVVMTHDDQLDYDMLRTEESLGVSSTFFVLPNKFERLRDVQVDIQLHFDKQHSTLQKQVSKFVEVYHKIPTCCRVHRLLWRADNFDFPLLASNGFILDSTKIGITPYRPSMWGRLLPIWEVPIAISDIPPSDTLMGVYNVTSKIENLFRKRTSPIVVNAHPKKVCEQYRMDSCYDEVLRCVNKYNYSCMNITDFYKEQLAK